MRGQQAYQLSGNGMNGQASWLSFVVLGGLLKLKTSCCGAAAMAILTASSIRSNFNLAHHAFPVRERMVFDYNDCGESCAHRNFPKITDASLRVMIESL